MDAFVALQTIIHHLILSYTYMYKRCSTTRTIALVQKNGCAYINHWLIIDNRDSLSKSFALVEKSVGPVVLVQNSVLNVLINVTLKFSNSKWQAKCQVKTGAK